METRLPAQPPWDITKQLEIFATELADLYAGKKEYGQQAEIFAGEFADLYGRERATSIELQHAVVGLEKAQESFALAFALVVEGNDPDTRAHLARTTRWATAVSERLNLENIRELRLGFLLHDIGKWAVPKEILLKPGPLDDRELKMMRMHPAWGVQMISDVDILEPAFDVIRYHHEKYDGTGYPYGLAGEKIPVSARVFAVADVFDALTSDRPYRTRSFTIEEAIDIIRKDRGTHFDPDVVDIFCDVIFKLEQGELTVRDDL
jgi:HD-GYP domain-containing protein (c-di-GMP phosphodiesterase class II)